MNPAAPCLCRGYDPADPCGHGDTSEGCPRHDPQMLARQYYCTDGGHRSGDDFLWCEAVDASDPESTEWLCLRCGSYIVCDECGAEFTEAHAATHEAVTS